MTIYDMSIQDALFKAAKVGHINLMREFIKLGAKPFAIDEDGRSALSYAMASNRAGACALLTELADSFDRNNHLQIEDDDYGELG